MIIKYFACKNGVKHSLHGEGRIIAPDGVIDDRVNPVPDTNLRNNIALYKYISGNWCKTSTVVLE